jgi:hypothetical protein
VGQRWSSAQTVANLAALWTLEGADDLSALLGRFALKA